MPPRTYPSLCLHCETGDAEFGQVLCQKCQDLWDYYMRQMTVYNEIKNTRSIWYNCTSEMHEEDIAWCMAKLEEMSERIKRNSIAHQNLRDALKERRRKLRQAQRETGGRLPDVVNELAWDEFIHGNKLRDITPVWIAMRKIEGKPSKPVELSKMIKRRMNKRRMKDEGK